MTLKRTVSLPVRVLSFVLLTGILFSLASAGSAKRNHTAPESDGVVLVSAASSLTDVMNELGPAFSRENRNTVVRFNLAASGTLQQQIEQGAPVDVFASASTKEIDALETGHFLVPGSRVLFARNRLVLIAPIGSRLKRWEDLKLPTVKRVALSNPDSVPSGRYAKETLTARGLWPSVMSKAVYGENVRQTLSYVSAGDVDAGIVFLTDAQQEKKRVVLVAEAVSGKDHQAIEYPAAVIAKAPNRPMAMRFVRFLQGRTAQDILAKYGFLSVNKRK